MWVPVRSNYKQKYSLFCSKLSPVSENAFVGTQSEQAGNEKTM